VDRGVRRRCTNMPAGVEIEHSAQQSLVAQRTAASLSAF
jgi:hypothetical protein